MRRIEFGAGIAALVLSLSGVAMLLFAPLVVYCGDSGSHQSRCAHLRYTSLASSGLDATGWALIGGMAIIGLAGAAGAIIESRFAHPEGAAPLWMSAALLLLGVVLMAGSVGLFFLPPLLALGLAMYASIRQRRFRVSTDRTDSEL